VHEAEILGELPRYLKGRIVVQLLEDVFKNSELFKGLDPGALQVLSPASKSTRGVLK